MALHTFDNYNRVVDHQTDSQDRANIDSVLMEKPNTGTAQTCPTSETGTASIGIRVARQSCKKRYTTK